MGGYITYAAVVADPRIRVATPILGSPQWKLPWAESPHGHVHRFFPTALLSQTAGKDRTTPPQFARIFHQRLRPFYAHAPQRLHYIEYAGVGHDLSPETWEMIRQKIVVWFQRFLAEEQNHDHE
jgi:hypothetical protein